jgi:hypothetical protein
MTSIQKKNINNDEVPEEFFEEELEPGEIRDQKKGKMNNSMLFDQLVQIYYNSSPFVKGSSNSKELEVRFGTRGVKHFTKNDYDKVILKLKSLGFISNNENGFYMLRIQNEFVDRNTGRSKISNVRVEINGIVEIKEYCKNNDIMKIINKGQFVKFTKKTFIKNTKGDLIYPINFDDFNFRVAYQEEEDTYRLTGINKYIVEGWDKSKKQFRYLNRVTFQHPDYPIKVDISIVKTSTKDGKYYTVEESNVFNNQPVYEIELEVDNYQIGPGTPFNNYQSVLDSLRKVIKIVLSGLQSTNYPISYIEQNSIIHSYMKLVYKDDYNPQKRIYPSNFIGPSSYTLKRINIEPVDPNSSEPNIRNNFTVTDKADGDRHLMFINETGKIYLINTNMNVIFTGAFTDEKTVFNSLLDGELILHDKTGKFINYFACFDIYYLNKLDIRSYSFMPQDKDPSKSRFALMKQMLNILKPQSIIKNALSPITIESKNFYPANFEGETKESIFTSCNNIITKVNSGLFNYNTDGLIFTPAFMGVGSNVVGKAGPLKKITWEYSFKWKPPQYNTIDFLVTTVKAKNGVDDEVKQIFEDGTNVLLNTQLTEYKTIILRCTFIEEYHGYINPCQNIIDDILPEYKNFEDNESKQAKPVQFYPTNPYDPTAGICNILLRNDDNNTKQMFSEEGQVFTDNTIVEFRYELSRDKGWRWIPLRVRYDKTSELQQGLSNYGNAYHVANSNWQSIHNPITEDMICTGLNIPTTTIDTDVYYNKAEGKNQTQAMKDFHNLFVKKILIKTVSKKGDTLIDLACGKGGDIPKWIHAQLSFVFGIDISRDNLENRLDGACARFLNYKKKNKNMPYALFVNGNSAYNIRDGSAMLNDKAIQITKAIFGSGSKEEDKLGKGVARQFGKGIDGFNISSCQFAIHYFFESIQTFQGFLRNISECTKLGGYFIGTCYDGKLIFNMLKNKLPGESVQIVENGKKIWEITKGYNSSLFEDEVSSIGYKIDVFQESINQTISEYLVNFDYLNRIMEDYGFKIIDSSEAKLLGIPEGSGLFSELFMAMTDDYKNNKFKYKEQNEYGNAINMNSFEKKISFLNRYFIFKKFRNVNAEKVKIETENIINNNEYDDYTLNKVETKNAVKLAKKVLKNISPKVKKLNKKITLIQSQSPPPSEEIVEPKEIVETTIKVEPALLVEEEEFIITPKPKPKAKKVKRLLIIEEDEEKKEDIPKEEKVVKEKKPRKPRTKKPIEENK